MPKPMDRSALADMRRTGERLRAEQRERDRAAMKRIRENRTPKPEPVMPDVKIGDQIRLVTGAVVTVTKVNRKSVITEGGVKWLAGQFEVAT